MPETFPNVATTRPYSTRRMLALYVLPPAAAGGFAPWPTHSFFAVLIARFRRALEGPPELRGVGAVHLSICRGMLFVRLKNLVESASHLFLRGRDRGVHSRGNRGKHSGAERAGRSEVTTRIGMPRMSAVTCMTKGLWRSCRPGRSPR